MVMVGEGRNWSGCVWVCKGNMCRVQYGRNRRNVENKIDVKFNEKWREVHGKSDGRILEKKKCNQCRREAEVLSVLGKDVQMWMFGRIVCHVLVWEGPGSVFDVSKGQSTLRELDQMCHSARTFKSVIFSLSLSSLLTWLSSFRFSLLLISVSWLSLDITALASPLITSTLVVSHFSSPVTFPQF